MLDSIWASMRENLSSGFANNKGADQPVQTDQRLCYCIISKLATGEISIF